jgi:iron(III) transport system permease protein
VLSASVLTADGSALTLQNYARVLSRTYYRASIFNSLTIGALASFTTTLIALPLAFGIARLEIRGKLVLIGLAALPLILPSFVGAYALLSSAGRGSSPRRSTRGACLSAPSTERRASFSSTR